MAQRVGAPGPDPVAEDVGLCVVLGAPRSGTTWLQRLLSASDWVVSPQETHLFREYLNPQLRQWDAHERRIRAALAQWDGGGGAEDRIFGLPALLYREDLIAGQRDLLRTVLRRAVERKPGVRWVLEKTPSTSLFVDLVEELWPDTRYVHILRDPRDVVRSMRAAGRSWGHWAPTDAAGGADAWVRHVRGARRAADVAPARYVEVRYEELRSQPAAALQPVLDLLHLPEEAELLVDRERGLQGAALSEVFAFREDLARQLVGLPEAEPSGFRRGTGDRPELSALAVRLVDVVAGEEARRLGYRTGWPVEVPALAPAWAAAAEAQRTFGRGRRWLSRRRRARRLGLSSRVG